MIIQYSIEVFKETSDDWHPNYHDNLVSVSFYQNLDGGCCTCVWGNDDCGMEYWENNEAKVLNLFYQIIGLKVVTRDKLKELGLYSA